MAGFALLILTLELDPIGIAVCLEGTVSIAAGMVLSRKLEAACYR